MSKLLSQHLLDYYQEIYSGKREGGVVSLLSRARERPVSSGLAIRFEIPTKYLEELTGKKLDEGKLYLVKGRIESQFNGRQAAWGFEIYRLVTRNFKLRIYLPRYYHERVVPGEMYLISIETIVNRDLPTNPTESFSLVRHGGKWAELPVRPPRRSGATPHIDGGVGISNAETRNATWIDWQVVAAWMDTEGYLYVKEGGHRKYALIIRQSEHEPLKRIRDFLGEQGIHHCSVKWVAASGYTAGGIFELKLTAINELDAFVARTRPFLMTSMRRGQYLRYQQRRGEPSSIVKFKGLVLRDRAPSGRIDWKVVAAWIDGEGHLGTRERGPNKRRRDYCLDISQKDHAPLESIRSYLEERGIEAKVVRRPNDSYSLQATAVSSIDLVVKETLPFIMTESKRLQYERYQGRRKRVPKRGPRPKPPLF